MLLLVSCFLVMLEVSGILLCVQTGYRAESHINWSQAAVPEDVLQGSEYLHVILVLNVIQQFVLQYLPFCTYAMWIMALDNKRCFSLARFPVRMARLLGPCKGNQLGQVSQGWFLCSQACPWQIPVSSLALKGVSWVVFKWKARLSLLLWIWTFELIVHWVKFLCRAEVLETASFSRPRKRRAADIKMEMNEKRPPDLYFRMLWRLSESASGCFFHDEKFWLPNSKTDFG